MLQETYVIFRSLQLPTSGTKCVSSNANNGANIVATPGAIRPTEGKPVECNLCHRKFKNIPALNGHMRLHGGYFKKVEIQTLSFIFY